MGSEVKGVYQLQGGIERYLQAFPEGGFWRGKNFVFDKREAIGAGNVNGVGGVVRMDDKAGGENAKGKDSNKLLDWGAECANCHKPWDRYIGKRKCYTCGVPVLVCDTCMSHSSTMQKKKKKKKSSNKDEVHGEAAAAAGQPNGNQNSNEESLRVRCPLCIEEGITVPAEEMEYTDNGVRGRLRTSSFSEGDGIDEGEVGASLSVHKDVHHKDGKAARSVLKWGGGHAAKKKEKKKLSRRQCQFGSDCVRKDCFFYHPEREKNSS